MLKIRFQRYGKKRNPVYRISVIEHTKKRDGKPTEVIGFYNPITKELAYNTERLAYWKSVGVTFSETAEAILKREPTHDLAKGPMVFKAKTRKEKQEALSARPSKPSKKKREKDKAKAEAAKAEAEKPKAEEAPKEEAAAATESEVAS